MLSFDPQPFNYLLSLGQWGAVVGILTLIALVTLFATSIFANGTAGVGIFTTGVSDALGDWAGTSFRRIGAIMRLTILEALRRKVLYVFVIFGILYMFAGWFMTDTGTDAELALKVYVSFVVRTIAWPLFLIIWILSCMGLPEDIKARSLHTVVTKPIRKHEIVLGRIFGYFFVGMTILLVTGAIGYVWILRMLPPASRVQLQARVPIYGPMTFRDREGKVNSKGGVNVGDEFMLRSFIEGNTKARAIWDFSYPQWSTVTDAQTDAGVTMESHFQAFRTWKGNLDRGLLCQFVLINEHGQITVSPAAAKAGGTLELEQGAIKQSIKVTAGSTPEAAAREIAQALNNADRSKYPWLTDTVVSVVADPKKPDEGRVILRAPPTDELLSPVLKGIDGVQYAYKRLEVPLPPFEVSEFRSNVIAVPRAQQTKEGEKVDLFKDVMHDGTMRIEARCLTGAQFLGMARTDLMVRLQSRTFLEGYAKSLIGVALRMLIIVVLGVCSSTFVKSFVAMFLSLQVLALGYLIRPFLDFLSTSTGTGGGPLESMYRIVNHLNPTTPLTKFQAQSMYLADLPLQYYLRVIRLVIPDFQLFNMDPYISNGLDVPWNNVVFPCMLISIGFAIPWIFIGHVALKMRELEAK